MGKPKVLRSVCLDEKAYLQSKENVATATRDTLALLNSKSYLKIKLKELPEQPKKLSQNNSICHYA